MIPNQRHMFDIPDDVAYLNCSSRAPLSHKVREAMLKGVDYQCRPDTYTSDLLFSFSEKARGLMASLINTDADNVAIIPSVSYGIQIAANTLPLRREGEILFIEDQFPSNVYPWHDKAAKCGGRINVVGRSLDQDWTAAVLEAIGPQTEIIALPAAHWTDGGMLDLEVIGMAGRAAGAKLVLDLTQSLGALPFDIEVVQPDFMVSASYKWLMGPYTLGYLYVAPRWHKGEPLEHNWMNRAGSEDFSRLVDYQDGFQPGARRFDMGEKANPAQLLAGAVALEQILDWGIEEISETLAAKTHAIAEKAAELNLTTAPTALRSPHFLGIGFPNGLSRDLPEKLAQNGVYVSVRGHSVRVSPHVYNTGKDIDRLFRVLETHC